MNGASILTVTPTAAQKSNRHRVRTVTVCCPFCGRSHTHGWPVGDPAPGVRAAHCGAKATSYLIGAPSTAVIA